MPAFLRRMRRTGSSLPTSGRRQDLSCTDSSREPEIDDVNLSSSVLECTRLNSDPIRFIPGATGRDAGHIHTSSTRWQCSHRSVTGVTGSRILSWTRASMTVRAAMRARRLKARQPPQPSPRITSPNARIAGCAGRARREENCGRAKRLLVLAQLIVLSLRSLDLGSPCAGDTRTGPAVDTVQRRTAPHGPPRDAVLPSGRVRCGEVGGEPPRELSHEPHAPRTQLGIDLPRPPVHSLGPEQQRHRSRSEPVAASSTVRQNRAVPHSTSPSRGIAGRLRTESGSAVLLIVVTAFALLWANSPLSSSYVEL